MAEPKTKLNDASVVEFLNSIENETKRKDSFAISSLMQDVTQSEPKMWGTSIVGFGTYTMRYASGKTNDWLLVGFSPRKQNLALYIMAGFEEYDNILEKLGKYTTGKSCLYIKKLADVDQDVLRDLIKHSVEHMKESSVKE